VRPLIHIASILLVLFQQGYPLKNGKPTGEGVEKYVEDKADSLITEFQEFISDTLYQVWIYAEDLTDYGIEDSLELGYYYNDEIFISTTQQFYAYELADLTEYRKMTFEHNNKFVKTVILHELAHDYFNQVTWEMIGFDSIHVDRAYLPYNWILSSHRSFGSSFIEEGICEYIVEKMGEVIAPRKPYKPDTLEELTDDQNRYTMKYRYSAYFLRDFLDREGLKRGIKILAHNPPPSYSEILNPHLFFDRLVEPVATNRGRVD